MTRVLPRFFTLLVLLLATTSLRAEKVEDLPIPTRYVNDFAQVLTPAGTQNIEDLSLSVHQQAHAELVVVTIKTLDGGQSVEDFTVQLEEKWKLGKKGDDRSALLLLVMNPHKLRIETGYGLEGMLNDAKVGAILDVAVPFARMGNYDEALMSATQGLANVVAADANVKLEPRVRRYHRQAQPAGVSMIQIVFTGGFILLIVILISTGHIGWAWLLLSTVLGGGRRGGDGEGGGGFGGVGGGGSGGGGASRDF